MKRKKRRKEKYSIAIKKIKMIKRVYDNRFVFTGVCICGWYGFQDGYFFDIEEDFHHEVLETFSLKGVLRASAVLPNVETMLSFEDSVEEEVEKTEDDYADKAMLLEQDLVFRNFKNTVEGFVVVEDLIVLPQRIHKFIWERDPDLIKIEKEGMKDGNIPASIDNDCLYGKFFIKNKYEVFVDCREEGFLSQGVYDSVLPFEGLQFKGVLESKDFNDIYFNNLISFNSRALVLYFLKENNLIKEFEGYKSEKETFQGSVEDIIFSYFWSFLYRCGVVFYFSDLLPFKVFCVTHFAYSKRFGASIIKFRNSLFREGVPLEDFLVFTPIFENVTGDLVTEISRIRSCRPGPVTYKRRVVSSLSAIRCRFREDDLAVTEKRIREAKRMQKAIERRKHYIEESEKRREARRKARAEKEEKDKKK